MILNRYKEVILCILFWISGITAVARVDNWSHKRPNNTVVQNQWGQAGYLPAAGYQQPLPQAQWNRYNQTQGQAYNNHQQHNNRIQNSYPSSASQINQNPWMRINQTQYQPQQPTYGQGSYNQSRPSWGTQQPTHNQGLYNQSRPGYGQGSYNQSRPSWGTQQPTHNQGSYNQSRPGYGQGSYNQSQSGWGTQQPTHNQGSYNQSRTGWGYQPTNSSYRPAQIPLGPSTNSHLYPALPNSSNNKPVIPSNTWSPPANQTLVYPQLPNKPLPVQTNVGSNSIPLAPLQPLNPQGPHNWHSGGQAALSYGPGHYSQPAGNSNSNPPIRQGSSNPYANIFN